MADNRIQTINLGSQHVSGAVFRKKSDGGLILDRYFRSDLVGDPSEEQRRDAQMRMALKEVVGNMKAKGSTIPYLISSFPVFMRFVKIPQLEGEKVEEIVGFEAQQQVPYDINDVVWDYQLMGDEDDIEVEVLLAAAKKDEVNDIDELVEKADLKSGGVEVSPVALYNAFRFNYPDLEDTTVLIDIGARTTDLIYIEGQKAFIRTIKIGGADITKAIAKEFSVSYEDADHQKVANGFVALGGPYADHEDPVIAGVSKVIRNSLTRLHAEVMRTTNFYRAQQGGSTPQLALISGATAALPFIREFFAEKLNLPIDYFNALRNVEVSGGVDQELAASHAHTLGDLVGSAIRQAGQCPIAVLLEPDSVKAAQDLEKRKPALIVAAAAVTGLLGALGLFYTQGKAAAEDKATLISAEAGNLQNNADSIDTLQARITDLSTKKEPFKEAVLHRAYWVDMFNYLSNKMPNDAIWITSLKPTSGGEVVVEDPSEPIVGDGEKVIDGFEVKGLWREGGSNVRGPEVVYDYFNALKQDAIDNPLEARFDLGEVDAKDALTVKTSDGTLYAYEWTMNLPIPAAYQVKYQDQ
ncbi:MAG: pilus assembly protein PilM [Verrucomicrobiales bacterium]|nr:pilus assembly protein PilM [Verrucomicrobiales bacterium]